MPCKEGKIYILNNIYKLCLAKKVQGGSGDGIRYEELYLTSNNSINKACITKWGWSTASIVD
jgi:hypothetical protein